MLKQILHRIRATRIWKYFFVPIATPEESAIQANQNIEARSEYHNERLQAVIACENDDTFCPTTPVVATKDDYESSLPPNTYIKRELIYQVIKLFKDDKEIRDSRFGTIERIIEQHYRGWFGGNLKVSAKLVFDIDRAFRYVQQHIPELRGKNWLLRQKMGGELKDDDFVKNQREVDEIKKMSAQMKLDFK